MKKSMIALLILTLAVGIKANAASNKKGKKNKTPESSPVETPCSTIEGVDVLAMLNPYDNADRCFYFMGEPFQLLGRNMALFPLGSGPGAFAFTQFGKESAPVTYFQGAARGYSIFTSHAASGADKTVHWLRTLSSEEREIMSRQKAQKKPVLNNNTSSSL